MTNHAQGVEYIGITCVFFCHDGHGNIFLHKRSKKARDEQGRWDCGGGALEFGEEFEDGVMREIKEEFGCDVLKLEFGGISNLLRKNQQEKLTHWIAIVFAAQIDPTMVSIREPEKIVEHGWFRKNHFPKPLHSMVLKNFELVKNLI